MVFTNVDPNQNILVAATSPPRVKICDFGISRNIDSLNKTFTHTGHMTTSYAAPELLGCDTARGNDRNTEKVDIWLWDV